MAGEFVHYLIVRARPEGDEESFRDTEKRNRELRLRIEDELIRLGLDGSADFGDDLGIAPLLPVECTADALEIMRALPEVETVAEDQQFEVDAI